MKFLLLSGGSNSMKKQKIIILGTVLSMVLSGVILVTNKGKASPGTIYVDDDGGADYTNIQDAINAASNGDTIYVFSGTYNENIVINKDNLNIVGEDENTTIINAAGGNDGIKISGYRRGNTIRGFTIKNALRDGIYIEDYCENNKILNCIIHNSSRYGVYLDYERGENNVIKNCKIYNNGNAGIYVTKGWYVRHNKVQNSKIYNNHGFGIYMGGDYGTISECECYNNFNSGIEIRGQNAQILSTSSHHNGGNGISIHGSNAKISDSTSYNNTREGILSGGVSSTHVNNCSAYYNHDGILLDGTSNGLINNCSVYNNTWSGISVDSSSNNKIIYCNSHDNYDGIQINDGASGNSIIGCNIFDNYNYGMYIFLSSNNNLFFHNNFNNTNNAFDECDNTWYNITLNEGNYWSNFDEPSEGAWDNNSDGIVDSPYYIPGGSEMDMYPLIEPWETGMIHETRVFIGNATIRHDETVVVPLIIVTNDPNGIGSARIDLYYNKNVVHVENVVGDTLGIVTANIQNSNGRTFMVAATGNSPGPTGTIYFANITLKAVGNPGDISALDVRVISMYDGTANNPQKIHPYVIDGIFSICGREGDVNQDGVIDPCDLQLVKQHIAGTITLTGIEFEVGDVYPVSTHGDGVIDDNDAVLLAEDIVGLSSIPP